MVRWLPLESNPDVMNKFLEELGVPSSVCTHDVLGLDPDLLAMVPQPVHAMLLLYPLSPKAEEFKASEEAKLTESGQDISPDVYYMKQFVGNACGTVALMHAVANSTDKFELGDGAMKEFLDSTKDMTPEERGHALENHQSIENAHEQCASEGQTEAPDRDAETDNHFIAFVNVAGNIYELDGRKSFPIKHGETSSDSFLQDAAIVVKGFMERDPENSRFAVVALAAQ